MKYLKNTLYVLTEGSYLSLDNANVVVNQEGEVKGRFPLHNLEQIVYFGFSGVSPALMGACAESGIGLSIYNPFGKFLARVVGTMQGNVLLRRQQYRIADNETKSCRYARNFIAAKIFNSRSLLSHMKRDHSLVVSPLVGEAVEDLLPLCRQCRTVESLDELRGYEGDAAAIYFTVFDEMILRDKETFYLTNRNRRPPLDPVNAMLSFIYTLLANDCSAALEGVGLDSYVGFLHRDRPGRRSMALDLMEELRAVYADRFVLTMINNRIVTKDSFSKQEDGAILLKDEPRKEILKQWQQRKKDTITHPYLNEKIYWGLVPHIQAMLLARTIRGDLEEYPAFLWK